MGKPVKIRRGPATVMGTDGTTIQPSDTPRRQSPRNEPEPGNPAVEWDASTRYSRRPEWVHVPIDAGQYGRFIV